MTTPRPDIPQVADELTMLTAFLDWMRATLRMKAGDLDAEQLQRRLEPSTMTLGGMVTHLAWVESWWFVEIFRGERPGEPWVSRDWKADRRRRVVDRGGPVAGRDLGPLGHRGRPGAAHPRRRGATSTRSRSATGSASRGEPLSLRWILVHMIEEYARHLGHADLIRESIDGRPGDDLCIRPATDDDWPRDLADLPRDRRGRRDLRLSRSTSPPSRPATCG